jgi:peptidoglycan/LPS O-acetylase OafA/YrhL
VALAALAVLALFFGFGVERIPYVIIHGALLLPVFSALLIGLAGPNWVASTFSWKPVMWLGETTLALYLLHFNAFILIHFYKLPERLHVARYDPWISFGFIMLMAVLVLKFYERPARRYFLELFAPTEAARAEGR